MRFMVTMELAESQNDSVRSTMRFEHNEDMAAIGWCIGEELASCFVALQSKVANYGKVLQDVKDGFDDGITIAWTEHAQLLERQMT